MTFRQSVENFRKQFADQAKIAEAERQRAMEKRPIKVFSEATLKQNLDQHSEGYEDQFIKAGFPPKICSQLVANLCRENPFGCAVLEIGCGKGFAGEYLKEEGFHNVYGIDCSYNLLSIAQEKKTYKKLERLVFGQPDVEVPESYHNAFEFVIVPSMINNGGFDMKVFEDILKCLRIGGFAIFATKLNYLNQDIYEQEINSLKDDGYWRFTAQHVFFRYDKLCGNIGQFSNKKVKIVAYEKTKDYVPKAPEPEPVPEEARPPTAGEEEKDGKKKKKKKTEDIAKK